MKKPNLNKLIIPVVLFSVLLLNTRVSAQEDKPETKKILKLHYFNSNNSVQYLLMEAQLKTGKKLEPNSNIPIRIFLDSNSAANLIGMAVTDAEGKGKTFIPPGLKAAWDASPKHKFIAVPDYGAGEEPSPTELDITKARISLDTTNTDGARSIAVKVEQYESGKWVPAKDVEMKVGVQRLGSILSAGTAATYTTDSTGNATAEFKRDSLPGDTKGNLVLTAKVEDNDQFGNLVIEKTAAWGIPEKTDNSFFQKRNLWTTGLRVPYWLLFIACTIIFSVWGTLIFLIMQFFKIRRLGKIKA